MNKKQEKTKNRIYGSLIDQLRSETVMTLSIEKLCRLANIARSTFYLHFSNLNEAIDSLEDQVLEGIYELCEEYFKRDIDELIYRICQFVRRDKEQLKILLTKTDNHFQNKIRRKFSVYEQFFSTLGAPKEYSHFYFTFVLDGALGVFTEWIKSDCIEDEKRIYYSFKSFFV